MNAVRKGVEKSLCRLEIDVVVFYGRAGGVEIVKLESRGKIQWRLLTDINLYTLWMVSQVTSYRRLPAYFPQT